MNDDRKEKGAPPLETPEGASEGGNDQQKVNLASRARNRTVMLTPDVAGHVRSLIGEGEGQKRDPLSDIMPAGGADYERPRGMGNNSLNSDSYQPRESRRASASNNWTTPAQPDYGQGLTRAGLGSGSPLHAVQAPASSQGTPYAGAQRSPSRTGMEMARPAAPVARSRIIGFLISFDKNKFGEIFELRVGRWIVSSRPIEHGEHILIDDETISPLHGILRVTEEGKIQVLDQLSEFGTGVTVSGSTVENEIAGAMTTITHGDILRLGKRLFMTCLVPTIES